MWFSPIFERFVEKSPVTVILRALMEVVLASSKLDDLFENTAQTGYTRELLFSTLVKMMTQVVCSMRVLYWSSLQSDVRNYSSIRGSTTRTLARISSENSYRAMVLEPQSID